MVGTWEIWEEFQWMLLQLLITMKQALNLALDCVYSWFSIEYFTCVKN